MAFLGQLPIASGRWSVFFRPPPLATGHFLNHQLPYRIRARSARRVRWAKVETDYRERPSNEEVAAALDAFE